MFGSCAMARKEELYTGATNLLGTTGNVVCGNSSKAISSVFFYLIAAIFLFSNKPAVSQNLTNKYISSGKGKNTLYHIFKQKKFYNRRDKSVLLYEINYLTGQDSALVNFSFYDRRGRFLDSISFVAPNKTITRNVKQIRVEVLGEKWHYR